MTVKHKDSNAPMGNIIFYLATILANRNMIIQLIFQTSSFAKKTIKRCILKTQTKIPQKNNQKNQQNIYYFYSHYTAAGNDLQTAELTEHSETGFMFSHILFNVML